MTAAAKAAEQTRAEAVARPQGGKESNPSGLNGRRCFAKDLAEKLVKKQEEYKERMRRRSVLENEQWIYQ